VTIDTSTPPLSLHGADKGQIYLNPYTLQQVMNTIKILSNNRNNSSHSLKFHPNHLLVSKMCLHHNDVHFMPLAKRTRTKCTSYNQRIHAMRSTPTTRQEPLSQMRLKTQKSPLSRSLALSLSLCHSHTNTHTHKGFTLLKIFVQVRCRKFPEA